MIATGEPPTVGIDINKFDCAHAREVVYVDFIVPYMTPQQLPGNWTFTANRGTTALNVAMLCFHAGQNTRVDARNAKIPDVAAADADVNYAARGGLAGQG